MIANRLNQLRFLPLLGAAALLAACGDDDAVTYGAPVEPTVEPAAPAEETAPMVPAEAPVYVGVWAAKPEWCANAPGSGEEAPIAITEAEFLGYENRCLIGDGQEGTEGGYQIALSCQAEGVEYQEVVEVDVDGETLRLKREGVDETVFVRCPDEGAAPETEQEE
ncbi:MAG: hypothetical protein RIC52_06215 [Amphiplicatus sp.]